MINNGGGFIYVLGPKCTIGKRSYEVTVLPGESREAESPQASPGLQHSYVKGTGFSFASQCPGYAPASWWRGGGPLVLVPGTADKSGQIVPLGIWPSQPFLQPLPLACPPSRVYLRHIFLIITAPSTKGHFTQASASAWRERPKCLILTLISLRFDIPGSSLPDLVILKPRPSSG